MFASLDRLEVRCVFRRCAPAHDPPREILANIADNLKEVGWSWGCVSTVDCSGRTIWIADAHRDDGQQFVGTARTTHVYDLIANQLHSQRVHFFHSRRVLETTLTNKIPTNQRSKPTYEWKLYLYRFSMVSKPL